MKRKNADIYKDQLYTNISNINRTWSGVNKNKAICLVNQIYILKKSNHIYISNSNAISMLPL